MNGTINEDNKDDYDVLYQNVIRHIEQTKNNIEIIREKAILDIYWNFGEILTEMGNISEQDLKNFRDEINKQIEKDPLLCHGTTNTHWLKLTKLWVKEHRHHDKKIMLSGSVTWIQWALLLNIVNFAPQRYWLACQTIKQKWDAIALLKGAKSLPGEYLNIG